jgi:hypothetical protein
MAIILTVLGFASAAIFLAVSAVLFRSGIIHLATRSDVLRDAKAHSPADAGTVIRGEVDAYKAGGKRDASIAAGLASDRRSGRILLQGRVSDEVLETLV